MANVTFLANPQPAPACYPSDVNGLLQVVANGGISGTVPDNSGGGIFVGPSPPSSSLTNKVWYKTDAAGRPLGVFMFYNGNWRKVYTGVGIGEIRMYIGTNTVFDASGRGIIGGDFDGWVVCNGNNGTPNLTSSFPMAGHMGANTTPPSPDGWWAQAENPGTWVRSGGALGPRKIAASNLPSLFTTMYGDPMGKPAGTGAYGLNGPVATTFFYEDTTLNSPNTPLHFEPYTVMGFIMFVGYA
jgi:hypothetical protein